jgi:hypothetical protein
MNKTAPKCVGYSMQDQQEQRTCSSSRSLQQFCLTSRNWNNGCMTEYLIAARAAIILWTNLVVMPAEIVFDVIEAELERRGVEL